MQENYIEQPTSTVGVVDLESSEIRRFELLRNELIELEKRVQKSTYQSENDEVCLGLSTTYSYIFMILFFMQNCQLTKCCTLMFLMSSRLLNYRLEVNLFLSSCG